MNKVITVSIWLSLLFNFACATTGTIVNVVERADGVSSTPDWASFTKPVSESDGKKYFLGYVEVDGDASKSAALNMADEKAMSEPMKSLATEFLDQNQVGEGLSSSTGQRIISSTRSFRPPMPGLHITKRYWEIVETGREGTVGKSVLRAYSLAEIPSAELEKAKQAFFSKLSHDSEIKKILSDVGQKQRDRALSSEAK